MVKNMLSSHSSMLIMNYMYLVNLLHNIMYMFICLFYRSAPLQSFQDELLISLKRAHRLSKLDPTYINRLRNVWLWQLANGRCRTGLVGTR